MKKLFLVLLLTMPLMAQRISVVNNTTQLSLHESRGLCIVDSPDQYGGIYTCIDSTYSEGTYAFGHLYDGLQWAKLGYTSNLTTGGNLSVSGTSLLTGTTTMSAALDGTAYIAGIDSFITTNTVDTITVTGIAPGDIFTFAEYCPAYSSAIDTVSYSYKTETGRCLVTRTIPPVSGGVYKSGGIYSYIRIK